MLKQLTSNCRSPYLIWDNGTRGELVEYLRGRVEARMDGDSPDPTCQLTYSAHATEPRVGQVYLRVFCDQPAFPLEVFIILKLVYKLNSLHCEIKGELFIYCSARKLPYHTGFYLLQ